MARTIFYAWQSDLPAETNKSFIEARLDEAINKLRLAAGEEVVLDKDVLNEAGSPEIAGVVLRKIEKCDVFVADVSIINAKEVNRNAREVNQNVRPVPNPNVLLELGYAAHARGWERIVCLFNTAFGRIEELPFDLRHHRIVEYQVDNTSLAADLERSLRAVLEGNLPILRKQLTDLLHRADANLVRRVRAGERSFVVNVPSTDSPLLAKLETDSEFAQLATFRSNGSQIWNGPIGPTNGYIVEVSDLFAEG